MWEQKKGKLKTINFTSERCVIANRSSRLAPTTDWGQTTSQAKTSMCE